MDSRIRRALLLKGILLAVATAAEAAEAADEAGPPPPVAVVRPVTREVTDSEEFTGRIAASATVELRPRATGYLTSIRFREGDLVKQGDLLFEIDARPYQAQLEQAQSQVELHKATLRLVQATLARDEALAKAANAGISREQLDQDRAAVEEALARVKASEAGVQICRLNMEFCKVSAPISGRIGRRLVDPGNLVNQDQSLLATLIGDDPLRVEFDVDERTLLKLHRALPVAAPEARRPAVEVGLSDEEAFSRPGALDFVDNRVDPNTGTIRARATLKSKDDLLRPGMFVRVRLPVGAPRKALLISDTAVRSDQDQKFVFVLDAENKVQKRRVALGPPQPDGLRVITEGLEPEDRVVNGRPDGIRAGSAVQPRESGDGEQTKPVSKPSKPAKEGASSRRGQAIGGILVETAYAGANAQIISDSVRAPIEQQVTGLEKVRYLRSRCTGDGRYALHVAFAPGVDPWQTQTLVQNRVALALPKLPAEVRDAGTEIRRGTAGILLIASLTSTDGQRDRFYLANYAHIQIRDELARVAGVGEVTMGGAVDAGVRVWLDMDRLDARVLNVGDVARALRGEKPNEVEDLEKLIVKTDTLGQTIPLRDVANVELGSTGTSETSLDGKAAVALFVHLTAGATPREVRAELGKKIAELSTRLPDGVALDVPFDFAAQLDKSGKTTGADCAVLDLDVATASPEVAQNLLQRSEMRLRDCAGVKQVLALSENPFDLFGGRPCLLVKLDDGKREKSDHDAILRGIRARFGELKDVTVRVRDLALPGSLPRCGYPVDVALYGPEAAEVREWADRLAERARRDGTLTDVWVNRDAAPRPRSVVEIDKERAALLGVALADISSAIEVHTGALPVNQIQKFGRVWRVELRAGARLVEGEKDLVRLKIRNAKGEMVPLGTLIRVREVEAPPVVDFLDFRPMVELTANVAPGTTVQAGRKRIAALAEEVRTQMRLAADYRLMSMQAEAGGK